MLHGEQRRPGPGGDRSLGVDVLDVRADGLRRDPELQDPLAIVSSAARIGSVTPVTTPLSQPGRNLAASTPWAEPAPAPRGGGRRRHGHTGARAVSAHRRARAGVGADAVAVDADHSEEEGGDLASDGHRDPLRVGRDVDLGVGVDHGRQRLGRRELCRRGVELNGGAVGRPVRLLVELGCAGEGGGVDSRIEVAAREEEARPVDGEAEEGDAGEQADEEQGGGLPLLAGPALMTCHRSGTSRLRISTTSSGRVTVRVMGASATGGPPMAEKVTAYTNVSESVKGAPAGDGRS